MSASDPAPDALERLHEALLAGIDPTAPARMAELLLPALRRRFVREKLADPHAVDSLIGLSIARYLADPHRWQRERGPLLAYLWRDVNGDVKNERDSRARLRRHEEPDSGVVELRGPDRNLDVEEQVVDEMDPFDAAPSVLERVLGEIGIFDELDRQLIDLLGARVRSTTPYAEVLGLTHLPVDVQAREVKRHKDRLKKRLGVIRGQFERAD